MSREPVDEIRERLERLAEVAVPESRGPGLVPASDPAGRPRLAALGAVAVMLLVFGCLVWWKGEWGNNSVVATDSSAAGAPSTTSQPLSSRTSATGVTPTAAVSTSTTLSVDAVAPGLGHVVVQHPDLSLARVQNGDGQSETRPVLLLVTDEGALGPLAAVLAKPIEQLQTFGVETEIAPGKTGLLTGYGEGDVGGILDWRMGDVAVQISARGYTHAQMAQLAALVELDSSAPSGLAVLSPPEGVRVVPTETGRFSSFSLYCGHDRDVTVTIEPGGEPAMLATLIGYLGDVTEVDTPIGKLWLIENGPGRIGVGAVPGDLVVRVAINSREDPSEILDALTVVDTQTWAAVVDGLDDSTTGCSAEPDQSEGAEHQGPGPLVAGETTIEGPIEVQVCNGAATGDAPATVFGPAEREPADTPQGALEAFIGSWEPASEFGPVAMPVDRWWLVDRGTNVTYGWSAHEQGSPPAIFNITVDIEKTGNAWAATSWQASGC